MKKLIFPLLATSLLLSLAMPSLALANPPTEIQQQTLSTGKCGDDAYYTYHEATGHLDITGTGQVTGGSFVVLGAVETLSISSGITSIGDYAFYFLAAVQEISIPHTVTSIGEGAFSQCRSLKSLFLPVSVTEFSRNALVDTGATVYAFPDSAAGRYALDNGNFVAVDAVPDWAMYNNPTPAFPDWSLPFVDYVSPAIIPDITSYNYNIATTRGEIAQFLYHMAGNGAILSPSTAMEDVGDYATAIAWCQAYGVMEGLSATRFGTNSQVTREQFALILENTAQVLDKTTQSANLSALDSFLDKEEISFWGESAMAWAVTNGLMSGNEGKLNPGGAISRVEVAVMLYNFNMK